MMVFLDYDNLEYSTRVKGLHYVAEKIIALVDPSCAKDKRITIRLYGGWYENETITKRAQDLETEIENEFPCTLLMSDNSTKIIVNCLLAYSMLADPQFHLLHTFRSKSITYGIKAYPIEKHGCMDQECPLPIIYDFIEHQKCPKCGKVKLKDFLYKKEQKLVDSMLIADMLHIANREKYICIVSSDDDFWPGIRSVVACGCTLIHIKEKLSTASSLYTKGLDSHYIYKLLNNNAI
ncbi:NYN domain-containing protein [uncultured Alistipes sp.]|jgi:uncharacterized LabA/DUF88 family protein|uniref:NYN domain-containing protein n=1 Tax=uncultured Alistipes sp. TaxID=538949 RepID=UPI00265EE99D|nr:NYN domain-containing protein [uncultured Alistipes sp.]